MTTAHALATTDTPVGPLLLGVSEVAAVLNCSGPHVRRLIRAGVLPAVRFGPDPSRSRLMVRTSDLERYVAELPAARYAD